MARTLSVPTTLVALLLLSLLGPGCGSDRTAQGIRPAGQARSADPLVAPAGAGAIVSPLSLPADKEAPARRGSYVEADLVKTANDFDIGLPNQNIGPAVAGAIEFSPQGGGNGLGAAAYLIYEFTAPGYDRSPAVRLSWDAAPVAPERCFVGLSNWQRGSWDWYSSTDNILFDCNNLLDYFDPNGRMLLVVLVSGSGSHVLEELRIGGTPPNASFSALPRAGVTPQEVEFNAAGSTAGEGSIIRFEWDPDGDGVYQFNSGVDPSFSHIYQVEGQFEAALRVTNSALEQDVFSRSVRIADEWEIRLNLPDELGTTEVDDMVLDAEGNLFMTSGYYPNSGSGSVMLYKFSPFGELQWCRKFNQEYFSKGYLLRLDAAGDLILGGTCRVEDLEIQILVQKWTTDGDLLWSRHFGDSRYDFLGDIQVAGGNIYFCGQGGVSVDDNDIFVARLDGSGQLDYMESVHAGLNDHAVALTFREGLLAGEIEGFSILGSYTTSRARLWRLDFDDASGEFEQTYILSPSNLDYSAGSIDYSNGLVGEPSITVSGRVTVGGTPNIFISRLELQGDSITSTRFTGTNFAGSEDQINVKGSYTDYQGDLVLYGNNHDGGNNTSAFVARLSNDDFELLGLQQLGLSPAAWLSRVVPDGAGIYYCGYLGGEASVWEDDSLLLQDFPVSWQFLLPQAGALEWQVGDFLGNVTDGLDLVQIDQAFGTSMIGHRRAP